MAAGRRGIGRRCGLAAALLLAATAVAHAQYFGANKMQYRSLHFQVLKTPHFDIYFHQDNREPIELAARMAEQWWSRLSHFFNTEPPGRQPLILYDSHITFEQTLISPELIDPGTGGFTEPWRRRIVLPFAGPLAATDHVIGHELVHAFQFGIDLGPSGTAPARQMQLPLWFTEGLAEFLSIGPIDTHTAMWLRDAVAHDNLPTLSKLSSARYFPYRWGHAFWAYVDGRWGEATASSLYSSAAYTGIETSLVHVLGVTEDEFTRDWHAAIRAAYTRQDSEEAIGTTLIAAHDIAGSTNVGPALSPDGRWIAFLSERDIFSIDLFIADAATGKVVRRLTNTASDPHYSALQFIDSAGAWDARSARFALGTMTDGRAALTIFDWPRGHRLMDAVIDDVDELYNPTWSSDGRFIAFTGITEGVTDLFVFDVEHRSVRRLTYDVFADLQPAWEPDGHRLAFVTDRFTTNTSTLSFGAYRIGLIDVDTGAIEPVKAFPTGKHVSPHWSADRQSLYFISDWSGTSDLYRVSLANGAIERLTSATTGLSGITELSPALSVATGTNVAAVTVYERGHFGIHEIPLGPGHPIDAAADMPEQCLPPVAAARHSPLRLRDVPNWVPDPKAVSKYRPHLGLERVAQASFGAGIDRYGGAVGGGIGVSFSDMLNTRWLTTAVQINQGIGEGFSLRDTAGFAAYLNQTHRWNWGAVASYVPTYVGAQWTAVSLPGSNVTVATLTLIRQTDNAFTGVTSYALSRARRIELQGGFDRLTFDRVQYSDDGRLTTESAAAPLTLGTTAIAFVSDTSSAGATSMVRGERYRLEAAPTFGTIQYLNLLADYRRYLMPVPFYTIAMRAMHVGRYGEGADDPRIPPMYLGYPTLVRGYDIGSTVENTCVTILTTGCQGIDDMLGSRLAVGNVELRFPLLRPFGLSSGMYGPVPVEVALFMDGGVAWRNGGTPWRIVQQGGGVWSTGVTLRTSVLGFGLGQFDIVRRFHQTTQGWTFQFNLAPAF